MLDESFAHISRRLSYLRAVAILDKLSDLVYSCTTEATVKETLDSEMELLNWRQSSSVSLNP